MVKSLRCGVVLLLLSCGSAGCALLHAGTVAEGPPLATPVPPPRVLTPLPSEPIVDAAVPGEAPGTAPSREPLRLPAPRTEKPDPPQVASPAPSPAPPASAANPPIEPSGPAESPRTLQTTANAAQTEQRVRGFLASAARDLARIDYRALNDNGKAQYDVAKRFSEQAEQALREQNVVFAEQLADKAAGLAALLLER